MTRRLSGTLKIPSDKPIPSLVEAGTNEITSGPQLGSAQTAPILPAPQKTIRRPLPGVMYLLKRSGITIYVDTQASPKA